MINLFSYLLFEFDEKLKKTIPIPNGIFELEAVTFETVAAAVSRQNKKPIAFISRTLRNEEKIITLLKKNFTLLFGLWNFINAIG